jgi:hypothetical protein
MMTTPGQVGGGASRGAGSDNRPLEQMSIGELRQELSSLRERERQFCELLECASREKLVHDLRNLLNEVQLLRLLAEQSGA